jgi:hypothetical protein
MVLSMILMVTFSILKDLTNGEVIMIKIINMFLEKNRMISITENRKMISRENKNWNKLNAKKKLNKINRNKIIKNKKNNLKLKITAKIKFKINKK